MLSSVRQMESITPNNLSSQEIFSQAIQTFTYIEECETKGNALGLAPRKENLPCICQYPEEKCEEECINRMLMIECWGECPVGSENCQNRRFQKKQFAKFELFLTDGKGYGLRALEDIPSKNTFIAEYIGEVLSKQSFIKRTKIYHQEGIEHHYFMSLKSDELIDATKKGGLARFMNHSCDPNCQLQKWVVGNRIRMGIFSKRPIQKGEELTFDYKFERFGTTAQKCLCGSSNCTGIIGKKAKTKATVGIEDDEDLEFIDDEEEESEDEEDLKTTSNRNISDPERVRKILQKALQSKNHRDRILKILNLFYNSEDPQVLKRFLHFHGLLLLKFFMEENKSDEEIVRKSLLLLQKLPIQNRNMIEDSKMDSFLLRLDTGDFLISSLIQKLIVDWQTLSRVYRIPKIQNKDTNQLKEQLQKSNQQQNPFGSISSQTKFQSVYIPSPYYLPGQEQERKRLLSMEITKPVVIEDSQSDKTETTPQMGALTVEKMNEIIEKAQQEIERKNQLELQEQLKTLPEKPSEKKSKMKKEELEKKKRKDIEKKLLKKKIAEWVIYYMSRQRQIFHDNQQFKKHAKCITFEFQTLYKKSLSEKKKEKKKELKDEQLDLDLRKKIKKFVEKYLEKLKKKLEDRRSSTASITKSEPEVVADFQDSAVAGALLDEMMNSPGPEDAEDEDDTKEEDDEQCEVKEIAVEVNEMQVDKQ